ncbi:NrsF family protein [Rhizobium sp. NPDC090279]|uniref:NrsF family protein n=1 Tax=Rhizobium sp. NPDC090279 TaxID=3364499 RepID=UPI00383AED4C
MNTRDLITLLSQDASVREDLGHSLKHATIAATLIAGIVFFSAIGFRVDIDTAIETGRFLFKFVITIALAMSAGAVLIRIGRPGIPTGRLALGLLLPVVLMVGAAIFELTVMPPETWAVRMIGHNSRLCLTIIPFLSLGPLACFLLALRHGAPERPALAGAIAGLAASGIAATFYAANCDDDSPLFVLLWYPIAISLVAAIGALIGDRILRW